MDVNSLLAFSRTVKKTTLAKSYPIFVKLIKAAENIEIVKREASKILW